MVTQEDTIFVQGMNPETSETEIADYFGAIGIIKVRFERSFQHFQNFNSTILT